METPLEVVVIFDKYYHDLVDDLNEKHGKHIEIKV